MKYLKPDLITKYIALEPNTLMHPQLRALAAENGYTEENGRLLVLGCGVEDLNQMAGLRQGQGKENNGIGAGLEDIQVDTVISFLTICSIPSPQTSLTNLISTLLKPGGTFIFHEHTLHPTRADVRFWQRLLTPLWSWIMDECRLDREVEGSGGVVGGMRDTLKNEDGTMVTVAMWKEDESKMWRDERENGEHLFPKVSGIYIKHD
jgi:SAM-dependent methyltransferase